MKNSDSQNASVAAQPPQKYQIVRNSILNLFGQIIPMAVAFFAMPLILRSIGVERFALLSLVWALLGYFSLFDLGLGKATTRYVASFVASAQHEEAASVVLLASVFNFVLGVGSALILYPFVPRIVDFIHMGSLLRGEAVELFSYVLLSLPFLTLGGTFKSALEGIHRFDLVNVAKAPFNALLFLIPVVGILFSLSLASIVLWIVISRIAVASLYFSFVLRHFQIFDVKAKNYLSTVAQLFRFGGWITVSNILNPIVGFAERFMISVLISVGAVSFYAAPYEMISRLAIVPFSVSLTLFPTFSGSRVESGETLVRRLIHTPMKYLFLLITPIAAATVFFSQELLEVWLGPEFASQSRVVLALLSVGFFFNAFAYVALSAVQGLNRPDLKAKLDIVLTAFFVISTFGLIKNYGIVGAAMAKSFVLILDALMLFVFSKSILGMSAGDFLPLSLRVLAIVSILGMLIGFALGQLGTPMISRSIVFCAVVSVLAGLFWKVSTDESERVAIKSFLLKKWVT